MDGNDKERLRDATAVEVVFAVAERNAEAIRRAGFGVIPLPDGERIDPWVLEKYEGAARVVMLHSGDWNEIRKHAFHLDVSRVYVASMPEKPDRSALVAAAESAKPLSLPGVHTPRELGESLLSYLCSTEHRGFDSGWGALDRVLTFKPGATYGILGHPKTGKSSFCTAVAANLARNGRVAWIASWEEKREEVSLRLAAYLYGVPRDKVGVEEALRLMDERLPLIVSGSQDLPAGIDRFVDLARSVHRRFGLDLIVVDNLHFIVREREHAVEALGAASKALRLLAAETNACILIVLQPRKPDDPDEPPTSFDARWTGDVLADVTAMIVFHRFPRTEIAIGEDPLGPEVLIRVERSRDTVGGDVLLMFESEVCRFREPTQDEVDAFLRRRKR